MVHMTHLNPIIYSIQFHIIQTFFPFSFPSKPNWLLQIHLPYAIVGSKPKGITAVATWGMLLVTMFRSCPIENPTKKTPNYKLHVPFSTSVVCHIKFIKLFDRLLNFASNCRNSWSIVFVCEIRLDRNSGSAFFNKVSNIYVFIDQPSKLLLNIGAHDVFAHSLT